VFSFSVLGHDRGPGVALRRFAGSIWSWGQAGWWSGHGGECSESGEDLGEQAVRGREPDDELAGVADEPAWDTDQPVPQRGDHGFAVADTVPGKRAVWSDGGGELVQPGGHGGGEQRTHIHAVLISG
jgi:hypothetical protein